MLFFGISYYTVEKTHPRVTPDLINKHENEKCGNYYTHKFLSKTLRFAHLLESKGSLKFFRRFP